MKLRLSPLFQAIVYATRNIPKLRVATRSQTAHRSFRAKNLYLITFLGLSSASIALADSTTTIAEADKVDHLSKTEAAEALGWISKPNANQCGGYYVEPNLQTTAVDLKNYDPKQQTTTITADATDLHQDGLSTLTGNVVFVQPGRKVDSQRATMLRDAKTDQIKVMDFYGHVIAREPSKITVGDHAHILMNSNQGTYEDVIYRLALGLQPINFSGMDDDSYLLHGLIAQGQASQLDQTKKGYYIFQNVNYSTCSPTKTSWHLHAKRINLDKQTGRGTAHHALLYVKSVPVFYTPYFSFPIDKRRQSGILAPIYGSNSKGGNFLSVPYYWNMAPNYDMTITPTWYTKRGSMFNTENRFLTERSNGSLDIGILPDDRAFSSFKNQAPSEYSQNPNASTQPELDRLENSASTRWYYRLKETTNFTPNLQGKVDYTEASDDYIQQDFSLPSVMNSQLLQQASLTYSANYWDTQLLAQKYQTLHPVTLLDNSNQYSRLPDFTFNLNYPVNNLDTFFSGETVNFNRQLNPGETFPSSNGQPTSGMRTNLQPGVTIPWGNAYSYVRPTVQWELTQYNVENQSYGYQPNITRSLPIVDIDSGLFFDRNTALFGHDYDQTLEPRLFYLRVPFKSQYQIPVFDTANQSFTFDQLFQTNRFTGIDRIGDANQVSLALTSRFLDSDTGMEKSKIGIGRIYYDSDRKVQLCNQSYSCQDSTTTVGAVSSTEPASPLAGFFNYALNRNWSYTSNAAWDPHYHQLNNANANFQYMPKLNHIINLGYNFVKYGDPYTPPTQNPTDNRNNLNQVSASTAWPLTNSIDGLAAWNYNVSHEHFQTYLYAASYNACCYAVRFGLSKTFYALNGGGTPEFTRQFLIQFVLKGFGGVGETKVLNSLTAAIPGYRDTFSQSVY